MDNSSIISIVLGSSIISSAITAIYAKKVNDKNNSMKYITEERQKWRSSIRDKSIKFLYEGNFYEKKKTLDSLQLDLNPNDKYDNDILKKGRELLDYSTNTNENKEEFLKLTSRLLKHDWERAKNEAKIGYDRLKLTLFIGLIIIAIFIYTIIIPYSHRFKFVYDYVNTILSLYLLIVFAYICVNISFSDFSSIMKNKINEETKTDKKCIKVIKIIIRVFEAAGIILCRAFKKPFR